MNAAMKMTNTTPSKRGRTRAQSVFTANAKVATWTSAKYKSAGCLTKASCLVHGSCFMLLTITTNKYPCHAFGT